MRSDWIRVGPDLMMGGGLYKKIKQTEIHIGEQAMDTEVEDINYKPRTTEGFPVTTRS